MAKLAICGGKAVVKKSKKWAKWPISDAADAKLVAKITTSNRWSFDGPVEWEFAEKFTAYQGAKYGMCVANGTIGIQIALEALGIGAYDEVIVPAPYWVSYPDIVVLAGGTPVIVNTSEKEGFKMQPRQLKAAITTRTKALVLNGPSNPTGAGYSPDDLKALAVVLADTDIFIISDDIYEKILY